MHHLDGPGTMCGTCCQSKLATRRLEEAVESAEQQCLTTRSLFTLCGVNEEGHQQALRSGGGAWWVCVDRVYTHARAQLLMGWVTQRGQQRSHARRGLITNERSEITA